SVRHQSADGEAARHRGAGAVACHRRRGYRMTREPMHRRSFLTLVGGAGVASALTLAATLPAAAQYYIGPAPWCAILGRASAQCFFYSFEQCWARASGISNSCVVNPYFVPRQ